MKISFNGIAYNSHNNYKNKINKERSEYNPSFNGVIIRGRYPIELEARIASFLKHELIKLKLLPQLAQDSQGWHIKPKNNLYKPVYIKEETIVNKIMDPHYPICTTWYNNRFYKKLNAYDVVGFKFYVPSNEDLKIDVHVHSKDDFEAIIKDTLTDKVYSIKKEGKNIRRYVEGELIK